MPFGLELRPIKGHPRIGTVLRWPSGSGTTGLRLAFESWGRVDMVLEVKKRVRGIAPC